MNVKEGLQLKWLEEYRPDIFANVRDGYVTVQRGFDLAGGVDSEKWEKSTEKREIVAIDAKEFDWTVGEDWKRQLAIGCFALLQDCIDVHENDLVRYVESPIELKFLLAFGVVMKLWGRDWHFWTTETAFKNGHKEAEISIISQFRWREYRSDFCLGGSLPSRLILIECDGHDYHERTKEQATYDRCRDAHAQLDGYAILRLTGSLIHNDPVGCAEYVFDFAKEIGR